MVVEWHQGLSVAVGSIAELDRILDTIEREIPSGRPIIATVEHPTGGYLMIGLGGELSVLSHVPADRYPPYRTSLGEMARDGPGADEPVVFFFDDHWSEFPRYQCLAPAVARRAMHDFFSTGELPRWLGWEEV